VNKKPSSRWLFYLDLPSATYNEIVTLPLTPTEFVLAQFPGRISIPLVEAGRAIGYEEQTCYNLHCKGAFPLKVYKEGKKPMVALTELIRYLAERSPAANDAERPMPAAKVKRGGRPSAAEREKVA
jgi:hypothetical protein